MKNVVIIGAGIAGLTAALSLAKYGIRSVILEQADELSEVGAGLQLSPNATNILRDLGVLGEIERVWIEPVSIDLASGLSLKKLVELPIAQTARQRWGAPYGVIHRCSLQKTLLEAVQHQALCSVRLSTQIQDIHHQDISSIVGFEPDLIIGADGVWSRTRISIANTQTAQFSGTVAWRFTISNNDAPTAFEPNKVTAFLGPNGHIVTYPLKEISGFNVVALTRGDNLGESWSAGFSLQQRDNFLERFRKWHPLLRDVITKQEDATFWPLFQVGDGAWNDGSKTIIIGDASHAMTPFAAQGAAMAIEDAYELATTYANSDNISAVFASFEASRKPRIEKARKRATLNQFAYHAKGPLRFGRDIILSTRPTAKFLADFDWLYGYKASQNSN